MTAEPRYTDSEVRAARQYMKEFGASMLAYSLVMLGVAWAAPSVGNGWRIPLALVPMIPLWFGLQAALRFFRRRDELARAVQLEAVSFAFVAGVMLTMSYGLLESIADLPRISWTWVAPLFIVLWGIGGAVATRRYK